MWFTGKMWNIHSDWKGRGENWERLCTEDSSGSIESIDNNENATWGMPIGRCWKKLRRNTNRWSAGILEEWGLPFMIRLKTFDEWLQEGESSRISSMEMESQTDYELKDDQIKEEKVI